MPPIRRRLSNAGWSVTRVITSTSRQPPPAGSIRSNASSPKSPKSRSAEEASAQHYNSKPPSVSSSNNTTKRQLPSDGQNPQTTSSTPSQNTASELMTQH